MARWIVLDGKDIRKRMEKGRGCMLWLVCSRGVIEEVLRLVYSIGDFEEVLRFQVIFHAMEASSKSTGSSPPVIFVDSDIWDLKK